MCCECKIKKTVNLPFCKYKSIGMTGRGEERAGLKMSGNSEEQNSLEQEIVPSSQGSKTIFGSY